MTMAERISTVRTGVSAAASSQRRATSYEKRHVSGIPSAPSAPSSAFGGPYVSA
jgi:hypothetical protein